VCPLRVKSRFATLREHPWDRRRFGKQAPLTPPAAISIHSDKRLSHKNVCSWGQRRFAEFMGPLERGTLGVGSQVLKKALANRAKQNRPRVYAVLTMALEQFCDTEKGRFLRDNVKARLKLSKEKNWLSWLALAAIVTVFVVLLALQIRWSRELGNAASLRMEVNLQSSMIRFREDLQRELSSISTVFDAQTVMRTEVPSAAFYAYRFRNWQHSSPHTQLVDRVYLWPLEPGSSLLEIKPNSEAFEDAPWPSDLQWLREPLADPSTAALSGGLVPPQPLHHPSQDPAVRISPMPPWLFAPTVPALMARIPVANLSTSGWAWVIVVLNKRALLGHVVPELVKRDFGPTNEYRVTIVNADEPHNLVYNSTGELAVENQRADGSINLFGRLEISGHVVPPMSANMPHDQRSVIDQHSESAPWLYRYEALSPSGNVRGWLLLAQRREGSLDAAVAQLRRRNMALGLGVALVLAMTIATMIVMSYRAEALARLQMDFVTGVSHELRTPLTIISSAADNIKAGIVKSEEQLSDYGDMIKREARGLSELVEQVLLFASARQNHVTLDVRPVSVAAVVDSSVADTRQIIEDANCEVLIDFGDRPEILCDPVALARVLRNLITNAVKYGGDRKWVGIRVHSVCENGKNEARISVSDRGIGISEDDLSHIFEPFYRSPAVKAAQIHGTGIGLALVQSITRSMGGKITVVSTLGSGSTFTVVIPAVT
jgi:signal transduction histidine kinase